VTRFEVSDGGDPVRISLINALGSYSSYYYYLSA